MMAVQLIEELKVQSHKDKDKLLQAKDKCYKLGFNDGVMTIGQCKDMKVKDAKPIVRKGMIDTGEAQAYYEPENHVVSRSGDDCVVALCDQWFLTYGEEKWRDFVMDHVKSDNFNTFNPKCQKEFEDTLMWLSEWACSRTSGLGTKIPWDDQFVIESLSDSTIYFAYYTIAHMLQGGTMNGSEIGPSGVKAEDLNDEIWE